MAKQITATLPGRICRLSIKVGYPVEADEEAFLIEAMKMETPVWVPCDGTVAEIRVQEGDDVDENQILAIITED